MSDKDFVERDVFTKLFPNATLQICLFHTQRSFKREVTTEKMGITMAERNRCLEIITAIIYSPNPEGYASNVRLLENTNIRSVID